MEAELVRQHLKKGNPIGGPKTLDTTPIFYHDKKGDDEKISQLWKKYKNRPEVPYIYVQGKDKNKPNTWHVSFIYGNLGANHYTVDTKKKTVELSGIS